MAGRDSDVMWMYAERMKMGFLMGGVTGACMGFLIGGMTVLRYGPGEKGYLATVGSQMLQTGGFLGFIMSIGMVLRNDSEENKHPLLQPRTRPVIGAFHQYRRLPVFIEGKRVQ